MLACRWGFSLLCASRTTSDDETQTGGRRAVSGACRHRSGLVGRETGTGIESTTRANRMSAEDNASASARPFCNVAAGVLSKKSTSVKDP
jgi:hypothetical protein